MRLTTLIAAGLALALVPAATSAGVVTIDFTTATITGLGTPSAAISEVISVEHDNPNFGFVDLQLDVSITATGGSVTQSGLSGLAVGDAFLNGGEALNFDIVVTTIGPNHVNGGTFSLDELGHGTFLGLDLFGGSFVAADDDNVVTAPIILNGVGPTSIAALDSDPFAGNQTLTVAAEGGATLAGLSSLSFNITAAPEPTSAALCGLFLIGACGRRRRREA